MRYYDINKKFSEKVAEYLSKGYVINTNSMKSSDGSCSRVDLVKGNELIRIWLTEEREQRPSNGREYWVGNVLILRVSKWNRQVEDSVAFDWQVWNSDMTTLEESKYYEVANDDGHKWYTTDYEEAILVQKKRYARYKDTRCSHLVFSRTESAIETAVRYLRRVAGYKRVSREGIVVIRNHKENCYQINYRNTFYRLR